MKCISKPADWWGALWTEDAHPNAAGGTQTELERDGYWTNDAGLPTPQTAPYSNWE